MMEKAVRIKYDAQVDILRIRLGNTAIEESEEVEPGVIVDYDVEGRVVGLEILDASEIVQSSKPDVVHTGA
jgi:uncharacterized protein YuzE